MALKKSVLPSQSSGNAHGSSLRCVVAAETEQLYVRWLDVGGQLSI